MCNSAIGDYKIHDFGYVLNWHYEWKIGVKRKNTMTGFVEREYKHSFVVELEVADERNPLFKFSVPNEASAKFACAKLNAILNG
jgi:hypothetical protein